MKPETYPLYRMKTEPEINIEVTTETTPSPTREDLEYVASMLGATPAARDWIARVRRREAETELRLCQTRLRLRQSPWLEGQTP